MGDDPDQDFLCGVLCILWMPEHLDRQSIYLILNLSYYPFQRSLVTCLGSGDLL